MHLKILANNIGKFFENNTTVIEEYILEYDNTTTIYDMKKKLKIETYNIDFPSYYDHPVNTYLFEQIIPYIEVNNKIYFDVNIDNIKIVDLLNTFKIEDVLEFSYNISGLGGGPIVLEILKNVIKAAGIFSNFKDVNDFVKYINKNIPNKKNLTNKKYIKNHNSFSIFSYIYSSNNWNHYILAEKLNLDINAAKNLLKGLGYIWNNSKKMYCITEEEKNNKQEQIMNIEFEQASKEEKSLNKIEHKRYFKILFILILIISILTIIYNIVINSNKNSDIEYEYNSVINLTKN